MSLFWKIFLSFWLGLIVFAGASIFITSTYLEKIRSEQASFDPRSQLRYKTEQAQLIVNQHGLEGLKIWLKKIDRQEAIPILMVDEFGEDLLQREVNPLVLKRMHRVSERLHSRHPGKKIMVVNYEGSFYRLVPDHKSLTLARVLSRPRVFFLPLLVAAMTSAVIGYLLARYLVSPIRRLSKATHAYANGDLSHRVSPSMGSRRDEIAELASEFDHMADRLQAVLQSQEQLLSDVSHELRSPLARIQAALGLAQKKCSQQAEPEINRIETEAERLDEMIGQLLSLSRLQAKTQQEQFSRINLTELLQTIVENADFEAQANQRHVELIAADLIQLDANDNLLGSALENIIRNAIRHTDQETTVSVSASRGTDMVVIEVYDQGPGVPEDMLDKIFEPFVRVDAARDRERGGYGLGMAIAYRAIKLHKGNIVAFNQDNGGLCVRIELPLQK